MRSIKQTHIQLTVHTECRADLFAESGRCKPVSALFNKFFFSGNIAACSCHSAAGIFNQRACGQIGAHIARLKLLHEFTVTIIYHYYDIGIFRF